jgi:hypothetical protein
VLALLLAAALSLPLPPGPLQPAARFDAAIERIDSATASTMTGSSWRPGCPVGLEDLRVVRLRYWGFDRRIHRGRLVVHREVALPIVDIFHRMFDARFPIARMRLVDAYDADDDRSTRANNTSAFNCRAITGGSTWSRHAYGMAIDINPVQNPYVYADGSVLDPAAVPYLDRTRRAPGMIHDGDVVDRAFAAHGWRWGGRFRTIKDYQHFDHSGRTLEWTWRT